MVRKKLLKLLGIAYLVLGGSVLINASQKVTGFVIIENGKLNWSWVLGFSLLAIGILVWFGSNAEGPK
jgi:hypothetical protein